MPDVFELCAERGSKVYGYMIAMPTEGYQAAYWNGWYPPEYFCSRGGVSVTFTAVHAAVMMGAKTVMTVGADCGWPRRAMVSFDYDNALLLMVTKGKKMGWFTTRAFARSAELMQAFPKRYPDVKFVDFSCGLMMGFKQTKIHDMKEVLDA